MTTPGTASTSDARKRAAEADQHWTHPDPAVRDLIAQAEKRGAVEALRVVRLVESDMSECAFKAWRSAGARRGLSDHEALLMHADSLTRWSERLRMAFDGEDYRADRLDAQDGGEGRG